VNNTNQCRARNIALLPGVETDLLFNADGMETKTADDLAVALENLGANAIETVTRYQIRDGIIYQDPVNYGPIAPGNKLIKDWKDVFDDYTRITATSVNGSTVRFWARATPN
jgi:hypothetical protein